MNAGMIIQLVVSTINEIPKRAREATTTKINNNLYSAFKKASAPFLIAELIDTILSLPGSCFFTHLALKNIKINPIRDKTIGTNIGLKFIFLNFRAQK